MPRGVAKEHVSTPLVKTRLRVGNLLTRDPSRIGWALGPLPAVFLKEVGDLPKFSRTQKIYGVTSSKFTCSYKGLGSY
jgi:hypothetical protein